uniref:DUF4939 domain-containing protein n=1 Tax=Oryzias melastigma TaxID=30732 RepID=A0A3B3B5B8_ORYME
MNGSVQITKHTTPAHTLGPRIALPDKFNGDPEQCVGFLMQCELFLRQQPSLYPTEEAKVSLVCSLLTGAACDWISIPLLILGQVLQSGSDTSELVGLFKVGRTLQGWLDTWALVSKDFEVPDQL